jgi:hypothetical protein
MFGKHLRCERAIAAGKRWISINCDEILGASDVEAVLARRRDQLSPELLAYCAREAVNRWMNSRANRYRGPKGR